MENRREFIKVAAALGLGSLMPRVNAFAEPGGSAHIHPNAGRFELPPLGYSFDALEPFIDAKTMELHYTKHHQAYVNKLNDAVAMDSSIKDRPVEDILKNLKYVSENVRQAVRNNGGGHWNHTFFWKLLKKNTKPGAVISGVINNSFGSMDNMKAEFEKAALSVFGSGWAWIVLNMGTMQIITTPNQDNPIMDIAEKKGHPVIALDVWEHAYYLKYQNRRPEYVQAFWNVLNWEQAEANLK